MKRKILESDGCNSNRSCSATAVQPRRLAFRLRRKIKNLLTRSRSTTRFRRRNAEKDPAAKIKDLDDFVAKFPNSTLLQYVYQLYYQTYLQMKNYPKAIEYADKLVAMGDKVDPGVVLQAHCRPACRPSAPCG